MLVIALCTACFFRAIINKNFAPLLLVLDTLQYFKYFGAGTAWGWLRQFYHHVTDLMMESLYCFRRLNNVWNSDSNCGFLMMAKCQNIAHRCHVSLLSKRSVSDWNAGKVKKSIWRNQSEYFLAVRFWTLPLRFRSSISSAVANFANAC